MTKWNQKWGGKWLNEQKRKKVGKDYKKQKQIEKRGPEEKKQICQKQNLNREAAISTSIFS